MRTKLRRIQALDTSNAIAEITCMGNKQWVFKHIRALAQVRKEEAGAYIFSGFIITHSALPFIATQYIHRL